MSTRNIVPRATGEGGIGTSIKVWLSGWFTTLYTTTLSSLDSQDTAAVADLAELVGGGETDLHSHAASVGIDGVPGGSAFPFVFDDTVGGIPNSGGVTMNNASPGSVTSINIKDTNKDGVNIEAWLALFPDAQVQISKWGDPGVYALYEIGTKTDHTGYWTMTATYLGGYGGFTNGDYIYLSLSIPGADGTNGTDGKTILYGTVAPTTEGTDGDFYIDTVTHTIYGPKATTWPAGTSLVGSAGAAGKTILYGTAAPTTEGVDGDFYIRTATSYIYGPKATTWPEGTSLVGPNNITTSTTTNITGLLSGTGTNVAAVTDATSYVAAASDSAAGKVELAIVSEVNGGSDTGRAVTADALAGSIFGVAKVQTTVINYTTDVATGDGKYYFDVPVDLNGMNLISASVRVITAGTTNATTFDLYNVTDSHTMLTANMSIASGNTTASASIDTSYDDVATGDLLRLDCDAISTTAPKGLILTLRFQLP